MNEDLKQRIYEVVHRVPLSVLQKVFRHHDLLAGQNLTDTLVKVDSMLEKNDPDVCKNLEDIFEWYLDHYLLYTSKAVYFFQIPKDRINDLFSLSAQFETDESELTSSYPLTIDQKTIDTADRKVYLVDSVEEDESIRLTFSAIRRYTDRITIPKSKFSHDALAEYGDIDEIIGTRQHRRQFFDHVIINKSGLMEVRIDNPIMDKSKTMPTKDRSSAYHETMYAFESLLKKHNGSVFSLPEPKNLFPLVNDLFFSEGDGLVRLVRFTTNNGNAKQNKANLRKPNDCCRLDSYHQGGSDRVNHELNPYRVHMTWPLSDDRRPELQLLGTIYHLEPKHPDLQEAIISKCIHENDYFFVKDKILSRLDS